MIDPFGRTITYLRVSVTDRCDFRCVYCMAEEMNFLPKAELLTLEELDRMCSAFIRLGVKKLRLTGGEPLVRRDIMTLFRALGRHIRSGALDETDYRTGGPARYATVRETGRRLGFITPLTHNFCESCNRVRLTCTGTLYMCLGQQDAADLRTPLRQSEGDEALEAAIRAAIDRKPKGHDFIIDRRHNRPAVARHMSVTGG